MGGVFAPSLFLGAALGGAFGATLASIFPSMSIIPSAFALVGMAAVLAGTVRAPVTAIMLLFEMTNDYHIILPLMFAVTVSLFFSQWLHKDSVYELSLTRKGIRLQRGRDVDVLETLTVSEVMKPAPDVISVDSSLKTASDILLKERVHGLPVIAWPDELVGVLTVEDINRAIEQNPENANIPVERFCTHQLVVVHPDDTVNQALQFMNQNDIGRLPVVDEANPHKLVGWLNRVDLIRAYDLALAKRTASRNVLAQVRIGAISEVEVFEYEIAAGCEVDGKLLSEIHLPDDTLVASIKRVRKLIIPHGATSLQAGDIVTIVAQSKDEEILRGLFNCE